MTRLLLPAKKGDTSFTVEKDLELYPGDNLALLATSYENMASDNVIVESYDAATGIITVDAKYTLNFYHWGAQKSPGDKYGGADMRGEVIILSRNIKILGEDVDSWGGHIITSDTAEINDDGTIKERIGSTFMQWVEMHNLSQIDTDHAALRFVNAAMGHSEIINCSMHNGYGWGVKIENSNNILIKDNRLYNFRPIGMMISNVKNVTVDRNVIGHITLRTTLDADKEVMDEECGICTCTYTNTGTEKCEDTMVTNNIVAGAHWVGMTLQGFKCGKPELSSHFGNVIHSVAKSYGGYGAVIHPDYGDSEQMKSCFEGNGVITYKNTKVGVIFQDKAPLNVVFRNMTGIDNALGLSVGAGHNEETEYNDNTCELHDSKIYGESPIPDCPQDGEGGYCFKDLPKCGFHSSFSQWNSRKIHPRIKSGKPMHTSHSFGSWGVRALFNNNEFINFFPKTAMGAQQNVFCLVETGFDIIPPHMFRNTTMTNVSPDAMAYFQKPNPKWANLKDCGAFPCTGPLNVLFSFIGTKYSKGSLLNHGKDFQIISNNTGLSPYLDTCEPYQKSNAYICHSNSLGIMMFESMDDDKKDRGMQPVYVSQNGTQQANKLNSFMDNTWDGFYAGQIRLSRFPALIDGNGANYNISFTGSPAKKMRFLFNSNNKTAAMTIRIAYPSAESRSITINGKTIEPNPWNDESQMYGPIMQTHCGENRYIGVKNILEFYLVNGCEIIIIPRDAIQSLVRMEWSLDAFFSNGGTTSFMDRVAAGLGIHASTIKIVSVYEGSLVVNYEIGASDPVALAQVQQKQTQAFATNTLNLGAPILDVQVTQSSSTGTAEATPAAPVSVVSGGTVTAPGYDPIIITKTVSNDAGLAAAAAAASTASGTTTTTTTSSSGSTVTVVTNRDGSSSYGVINSSGATFSPDVRVVVSGNQNQQSQSISPQGIQERYAELDQTKKAEAELQIEEELYQDMDLMQGGSDNGGLIIIVSVVILGLIGTVLLTLHMIQQNKHKRILEANLRDQKMMELSNQHAGDFDNGDVIEVKSKNSMFIKKLHQADDLTNEESTEQKLKASNPLEGIIEYGDQYNANHDFAIFQGNNERLGGVMNLAQKQNQADCIADKSMSVASQYTERDGEQENWAYTERTEKGEDSKTPMNKNSRRKKKSVNFSEAADVNQLPENQEWADLE